MLKANHYNSLTSNNNLQGEKTETFESVEKQNNTNNSSNKNNSSAGFKNQKTPNFGKKASDDLIDNIDSQNCTQQLLLTQESSILTNFSTTMNNTIRSGLRGREFLNG